MDCVRLPDTDVGITLSEHRFGAGFVRARDKHELAADIGITDRWPQGPAGQRLGKTDNVRLRIAAAHAKRVQFEDFPREILVEALVAIDPGDRIRADRLRVVQIEQHRRVAFGGEQELDETAQHVRTDGLALVAAGHYRSVAADAKMVGPEPHQPLDKADFGVARRVDARLRLGQEDLLRNWTRRGLGGLRLLGRGHHRFHDERRASFACAARAASNSNTAR